MIIVDRALERRRLLLENREYQRRLEEKIQRQAGQLLQYYKKAEKALSQEQAAVTELEAASQPQKDRSSAEIENDGDAAKNSSGLTKKLSQLLGSSTSDSTDEDGMTDSI